MVSFYSRFGKRCLCSVVRYRKNLNGSTASNILIHESHIWTLHTSTYMYGFHFKSQFAVTREYQCPHSWIVISWCNLTCSLWIGIRSVWCDFIINLSTWSQSDMWLVPIPAFLDDYRRMRFEPLRFNIYLFSMEFGLMTSFSLTSTFLMIDV